MHGRHCPSAESAVKATAGSVAGSTEDQEVTMNSTDREEPGAAPVTRRYDAIVVGARCAGAATAMLLAGKGYDVLLIDRATFPSDTVSTHLIHPPGLTALRRWGLLDDLVATGCPWLPTYTFDFGPLVITGTPTAADGTVGAYAPRRIVLDQLLVRAAEKAGAELREGFSVTELIFDGERVVGVRGRASGGAQVSEYGRVVIGADGVRSRVAEQVNAPRYREGPVLATAYYAYWSGVATEGARWMIRPGRGIGVIPTNDDMTLVLAAWPQAKVAQVKQDLQDNYLREVTAALGDRLHRGRQETRVVGEGVPNRFLTPYGPGWALVGDAGYAKDPVTAQGITDAFHDAEMCAGALDAVWNGSRGYDEALSEYQQHRDERVLPVYEFTNRLADLAVPPPPQMQQLLGAIAGNHRAMDEFASVFAGALPVGEFFSPAHIASLIGTDTSVTAQLPPRLTSRS
jgi:2-polyprenyl-6-methoxyphenol hydroxylase-like FAD-dependent oxidoreductase